MHYGKLPSWAVRGARFYYSPLYKGISIPREPKRLFIIRAVVDDVMVVARSYDKATKTWDYCSLDVTELEVHAKPTMEKDK